MAFDDDSDDERPRADRPLPPDDRLWRHPSEVAAGAALPTAWTPSKPPPRSSRGLQVAALGGAALAGMVVAASFMWVARPTKVVMTEARSSPSRPVTTAVFTMAAMPSERLAKELAPSLVQVSAAHDDRWTAGTGVWLDRRGTVAVASTIVDASDDIVVTDVDGRRSAAVPAATDDATGITILHVADGTGTPVTQRATEPEAGQPVAIIGAVSTSPQGEPDQRVMAASISATGIRTTISRLVLHDALQLDRAVPSDAVGGVVVDAEGHLVGIILARSGDADLAVVTPADQALRAARALRDDGTVRRAWLGVEVVDTTPLEAKLLGTDGGSRLTQVTAGSPAEAAGLKVDDVITDVDGRTIHDASDLVVALRSWAPGDHVVITWHRGADTQQAELTLGG